MPFLYLLTWYAIFIASFNEWKKVFVNFLRFSPSISLKTTFLKTEFFHSVFRIMIPVTGKGIFY